MENPKGNRGAGSRSDGYFIDYGNLRYKHGFQNLAHETIRTGEDFLVFVRQIEAEVRPTWNRSERHLQKLRSEVSSRRSQSEVFKRKTSLMRQILRDELEKRTVYEARVAELDNLSRNLRRILGKEHGDGEISDDDRQHPLKPVSSKRTQTKRTFSPRKRTSPENLTRPSYDRFSPEKRSISASGDFFRSSSGSLNYSENAPGKRPKLRRPVSQSATVTTDQPDRPPKIELKEEKFILSDGCGDLEIIVTTNFTIPENGPVKATSSIKTIPGKRVSFADQAVDGKAAQPSAHEGRDEPDGWKRDAETAAEDSESESLRGHASSLDSSSENLYPNPVSRQYWKTHQESKAQAHFYGEKFFLKPDTCTACGELMAFGFTEKACVVCRAACHTKCVESAKGPCVPPIKRNPILDQNGQEIGHCEGLSAHRARRPGGSVHHTSSQTVRSSHSTLARPHDEVLKREGSISPKAVMEGGCSVKKKKSVIRRIVSFIKPRCLAGNG